MKTRLTLLCAMALAAFLVGSPASMAAVVVAQLPAAQSPALKSSPGGVVDSAKAKAKDKDKDKNKDDDDDDDKKCKKPKKHKPSRC